MDRKLENPWIITLLLILAAISGWQVYELSVSPATSAQQRRHFPDSIGSQLTLKRFDQTGFLESISQTDKATHYPDTNITDFQVVNMQVFSHRPGVPPWYISAPAGKAYNHGNKFELNGQVNMKQAAYPNHLATQIQSSEVTIVPNDKLISTDQPVVLTQPGLLINAVGFRYNYDTQVLNLLSQVQVHYVPAQRQATSDAKQST